MWAWLRLGWARNTVLALLLTAANIAAMRYTQDTAALTQTQEYFSLGGQRAWRLSYEQPRRNGLLDHFEWPQGKALIDWAKATHTPVLARLGIGFEVRQAHERGGLPHGAMVAINLDFPVQTCWVLSTRPIEKASTVNITELLRCQHPGAEPDEPGGSSSDHGGIPSGLRREIKALWGRDSSVVVSPEMAERALGPDWTESIQSAWVGAGAVPVSRAPSERTKPDSGSRAAIPASLAPLQARLWQVHEIRREAEAVDVLAQAAKKRWQWAMAGLGLAVGGLSAWGYRHVLALMTALRRTGGAGAWRRWHDALDLSTVVALLMLGLGAALLLGLQVCGSSCGLILPNAALSWVQQAERSALWALWAGSGLVVGLVATTSAVVLRASRRSLQGLMARGAAG